jgi:hypothetical protein
MRSVTSRQFRRTPGRVGLPEARTETLVVTRWKEDVWEYRGRVIFDIRNHPQLPQWQRRQAHHERTANLVWARDHCGGLFRIVWLKAKDPNAKVRKITQCYPDTDLWMRIISPTFDEKTGEFFGESAPDR